MYMVLLFGGSLYMVYSYTLELDVNLSATLSWFDGSRSAEYIALFQSDLGWRVKGTEPVWQSLEMNSRIPVFGSAHNPRQNRDDERGDEQN